ncbi:MAG TPA: DapH/DapD/GlmU-related protein [Candidatus Polarisedimenticolia bacterium]|nr:DapH/DapD/GlmU-related protein [Candidatus Polarisedimenticolia bacterium]
MKHLLDVGLRLASLLYLVFQFLVVGLALLPAVLFVKLFWLRGSALLLAFALGIGYLIFGLAYLTLIVLIRHLIRFRSREGDYPFFSSYAMRWAFLGSLVGLAKILILDHIKGMPLLNAFFRLMGARIGRNVLINTCNMFDFDLIEIGDDAFIGGDAVIIGHVGERGLLRIRPVRIGARCTVGQSSVVFPGAVMEEGSVLGALSLLPKGKTLPAGSVWGGNPIQEIRRGPV